MSADEAPRDLPRQLTLLDSTMINVGSMIGSGIFIVPATIAMHLQSTVPVILVWIIGGVVSLFGALCMAELGAMMPKAGGQYVYLKNVYGPVWGFLYGWSCFTVIMTASIAAVAVAFATYVGYFIPMDSTAIKSVAIASIVVLTAINCFGTKLGALLQNGMTFVKIAALGTLGTLGFLLSGAPASNFEPLFPAAGLMSMVGPFGLAMMAVLWAYDGWIEITFVAGEVKRPERNIHRSLFLSTMIVVGMYLIGNIGLLYVLSPGGMAQSPLVASDAAAVALGSTGAAFVALAVVVSTLGANNGFVFTAARIYYAMAREGLLFSFLTRIHPRWETPVASLLLQCAWACILIVTGTFDQLITYVVFASWVFYAMSCYAVIILRKRNPQRARPYRTWGYPFTPVLFIVFAAGLVVNTVIESPRDAAIGAGLIVAGLPVYYYWAKKGVREGTTTALDRRGSQ